MSLRLVVVKDIIPLDWGSRDELIAATDRMIQEGRAPMDIMPVEPGATQRLYDACKAWVEKNQVDCAESIVQVDRITRVLPDLAEIVCQHVGYYKYPEGT